jgi:hypothetical protein
VTALELIEALKKMPPDAKVCHLWDGALRTEINHVWLARCGVVATADDEQVCYDSDERPMDSPTTGEDRYWQTPDAPERNW